MRTLFFGLACLLVARTVAADPVVYVISTPNDPFAESELHRLVGDGIEETVELGRSVTFGSTPSHLAVMGVVEGRGQLLRVWDLTDGRLVSETAVKEPVIFPVVKFTGASKSLYPRPDFGQVLYGGYMQVDFSREIAGRVLKEQRPLYALGGIDIQNGDTFEVEAPGDIFPGASVSAVGDRVGIMLRNEQFVFYEPDTRSLVAGNEDVQKEPTEFFGRGLGLLKVDDGRIVQTTDLSLKPLASPVVIAEQAGGQHRFAVSDSGAPLAVTAMPGGNGTQTTVTVRDIREDREMFRRSFPIRLQMLQISEDASTWVINNRTDKTAVHFDRVSGVTTQIDYSRFELAQLIVSLLPSASE